jgi:5-methylthioribose kinase
VADHEDVDYPVLDERSLPAYLARMPEVASRLGGAPADWVVQEIGDGNVNFVFAVRGPGGDVCVKQALPYVRAVGAEWPLTPERTSFEYRALLEHGRYVAGRVPKPLHYDPHLRLLIVEYLGGLTVMRHGLVAGACYPNFAEHIGSYLAQSLFFTSDLALAGPDKRILMSLFHTNTEMCQIMEDMVFTEPYWDHPRNRCTSPQLDDERYQLQRDSRLKIAVARLKTQYLANAEALIHGDLHTGSIMVSLDDTRVIDQEFACYGANGIRCGYLACTPPD